jgi:UDP-glucose 4-epimerase
MQLIKNKKIAITGGAGFIGSNLTRALSKDNEIVIIDDLSSGNIENLKDLIELENIEFIKGSITNLSLLNKAFLDVDYVFHLAAIASVLKSLNEPIKTINVNVNGTLNILIASKNNDVKKVVNSSSSAVYGNPEKFPIKEKIQPMPLSPYSASKIASEYYCKLFTDILDLQTVSLRYFNVYGPRQNPKSEYAAVIPKFISQIISDQSIIIFGDGKQTRDFVYVDDVINANILAAKSNLSDIYNVGSGKKISINQIAEKIMKLTKNKVKIIYDKPRKGDVYESYSDISKIKTIGYSPKTSLDVGLNTTINWFK